MNAAGTWARAGLAVVALWGGVSAAQAPAAGSDLPTAEDLVRRVAAAWDPVRVSLKATMTVESPERPASTTELWIRRAGHGRTRIDFLAPARDRGKVILEDGGETWLYLPRTGRVVEVPARRNPLAGGVMFEDLFPGGAGAAAAVEANDEGFVLVLAGGADGKSGGSRVTFDRSTLLPLRRDVYAASGRLLKTMHVDATRDWQGARIPSEVRLVDHLRHTEARIEILEASELSGDLDELFSKDRLRPAVTGDSAERR
jgi:outer membrane lipoprotein-sorting protein